MKISRNSWHYWLVSQIFDSPSKSLCVYFWQVPIAALSITFMAAVVLFVGGALLWILSMPVVFNVVHTPLLVNAIFGAVSLFLWCAVFEGFYKTFYNAPWNKVLLIWKHKPRPEKKPSLVWEYIKAKKDKVCPTIEFYWS